MTSLSVNHRQHNHSKSTALRKRPSSMENPAPPIYSSFFYQPEKMKTNEDEDEEEDEWENIRRRRKKGRSHSSWATMIKEQNHYRRSSSIRKKAWTNRSVRLHLRQSEEIEMNNISKPIDWKHPVYGAEKEDHGQNKEEMDSNRTTNCHRNNSYLLDELDRVLAITDLEERNWKEANVDQEMMSDCNDSEIVSIYSNCNVNTIQTEVQIHPLPKEYFDEQNTVPEDKIIIDNGNNCQNSFDGCLSVIKEYITPTSPQSLSSSDKYEDNVLYASQSTLNDQNESNSHLGELGQKMKEIVTQFRNRANTVKQGLEMPPSPPELLSEEEDEEDALAKNRALQRLVYQNFDAQLYASQSSLGLSDSKHCFDFFGNLRKKLEFIDPRGYINICWLFFIAIVFLYNAWVIPLRFFFPNVQSGDRLYVWLFFDYLGDAIFLIDLLVYKHRVLFMENGFWVKSRKRITRNYVRKGTFLYDLLSLLPSDLLYFHFGFSYTILRLPRLFKVVAFWEFIYRLDAVLAKPYILRIVKTVNYMLYLIHLNACAYYAVSEWEGIGSNTFVYDGQGNAYIRCFYFATKTATSIGKNKKPTNVTEIIFMTCSWLMGVFVFAILIGDCRDIVSSARKDAIRFQVEMDGITAYMNKNRVKKKVQRRIKQWMDYTWKEQKSFDETKVLEFLPLTMRTDIAMRVHYHTLVKVKLFRNCEPGLLKDLVVLLKPILYMPGDYICRKSDIGKEMFIIQSGQVQVLGGIDGKTVLCTLGQGSVFGEIALLGVGGMNKRTADVVSVGFSNLFVLQKNDLEMVLKDYPDAKRILNARAKKLMKENEARIEREKAELRKKQEEEEMIRKRVIFPLNLRQSLRSKDPALLDAVMKALPASSRATAYLRKGSRAATLSLPGSRKMSEDHSANNVFCRHHTSFRQDSVFQSNSLQRTSVSQDDGLMDLTQHRQSGFSSLDAMTSPRPSPNKNGLSAIKDRSFMANNVIDSVMIHRKASSDWIEVESISESDLDQVFLSNC